jgi:Rieske Fe-S protein
VAETSRRTFLVAAGLAGVAGCAKYGEPKNPPSASAPANAVLGKTADIPVGGGKIFAPNQVVVTQPTQGTFKAFSAICTHQQCIVARIEGSRITCTCHGSQFSTKDGSVITGPATKPLNPLNVAADGDTLTIS